MASIVFCDSGLPRHRTSQLAAVATRVDEGNVLPVSDTVMEDNERSDTDESMSDVDELGDIDIDAVSDFIGQDEETGADDDQSV